VVVLLALVQLVSVVVRKRLALLLVVASFRPTIGVEQTLLSQQELRWVLGRSEPEFDNRIAFIGS